LINGRGEPLAPGSGFAQVRDAMAAWSGVAGSAVRYEDAGPATAFPGQLARRPPRR